MTSETDMNRVDTKAKSRSDRAPQQSKMDSVDRRGVWSPPGGRELFLHSHLSDIAGVVEADGQEEILDPTNLRFVESILNYETANKIPPVGGLTDKKFREFAYESLSKLLATPDNEPRTEDAANTDTGPVALAATAARREASARRVIEQLSENVPSTGQGVRYVVRHSGRTDWAVRAEDGSSVFRRFDTKAKAVAYARALLKSRGSEATDVRVEGFRFRRRSDGPAREHDLPDENSAST
jgi:hypothetical protein